MSTADGGPAFPTSGKKGDGMTLRDYFAGCALQSYLSSNIALQQLDDAINKSYTGKQDRRWVANRVLANRAYRLADAMLTARKTQQPDQSIELSVVEPDAILAERSQPSPTSPA